MSTTISEGTGAWGVGILVVGGLLIIGTAFSVMDSNQAKTQKMQEQGCDYYQNTIIEQVPAKCQNYFRNQYEPGSTMDKMHKTQLQLTSPTGVR